MLIISHRGNVTGPKTINLAACACEDWGIELDLRWDPAGWYFDHTPRGHWPITDARTILQQFRHKTIAVNIKEVGREDMAVKLLREHTNAFVFDMELCGADPEAYSGLPRAIRMSDRIDEKNVNKFPADIIWLDEFKRWVEEIDIAIATNKYGLELQPKKVFWVSPDLHTPLHTAQDARRLEERWQQMIVWGVDGICTDYPRMLERCIVEWDAAA